jgi:hypothetical protein
MACHLGFQKPVEGCLESGGTEEAGNVSIVYHAGKAMYTTIILQGKIAPSLPSELKQSALDSHHNSPKIDRNNVPTTPVAHKHRSKATMLHQARLRGRGSRRKI